MAQPEKININEIEERDNESRSVGVVRKKTNQSNKEKLKDNISEFYNGNNFNKIQKPTIIGVGRVIWFAILASIIVGAVSAILSVIYFLNNPQINFLGIKTDITKNFPLIEKNNTIIEAKTIQVSDKDDINIDLAIRQIKDRSMSIFKTKTGTEENPLPFLDQVYAPWQKISNAFLINKKAWLVSGFDFDVDSNYVAIDKDNNIFSIKEIVKDELTGVNFLKIDEQNIEPVTMSSIEDFNYGSEIFVLDKFNNVIFTAIRNPRARNIFKTEDIVRSTDKFADYLRVDASIASAPAGFIFNSGQKLIGIIVGQGIIPSWHFSKNIDIALVNKNFSKIFLGIDYIRIEEAPGLASKRFRGLKNGAIVYGPPATNSPAFEAGIKNADVIIKVDGIVLDKDVNFTYLIQQKKAGDVVEVVVLRDGEELSFSVNLK